MKKQLDVVGAVIVQDGKVLCAQRGPGSHLTGFWEFPGGKVELGETPRAALQREISEELGCEISVGEQLTQTTHEYDFAVITLTTFYCSVVAGVPALTEHAAVAWLGPDQLHSLEWAPADIPAVDIIVSSAR